MNALDYLVKPIREERFTKAIEKTRTKLREQTTKNGTFAADRILFIKEGEKTHFVRVKDIHLIESTGNYARLHFNSKKALIKRSLNQLEKTLDPQLFFRISRTEIINTAYIKQVDPLPNGRLTVSLQTGEVLTVSSRQSVLFKNSNKL